MLTTRQVFMQFILIVLFGLGNVVQVGAEPVGAGTPALENRPAIAVWMAAGSPHGLWKAIHGKDDFPVETIMQTMRDQRLTDLLFFVQPGRGDTVYYPTKHPLLRANNYMGDRDYTEELLAACDQAAIRLWLAFTPPGSKPYPGTDIQGLNDPRMIKLYCEMIEEIATLYGHHKSLAGFLPHEVDCAEVVDNHEDDRADHNDR